MHVLQYQMGSSFRQINNIGVKEKSSVQYGIFFLKSEFNLFINKIKIVTYFFNFKQALYFKLYFCVCHKTALVIGTMADCFVVARLSVLI